MLLRGIIGWLWRGHRPAPIHASRDSEPDELFLQLQVREEGGANNCFGVASFPVDIHLPFRLELVDSPFGVWLTEDRFDERVALQGIERLPSGGDDPREELSTQKSQVGLLFNRQC